MALYHFSAQMIGRSAGRSAVACSAYRAGEKLQDERTGLEHDYTKKSGVVHSEIMLPENAPIEYKNREVLWNAVEHTEKRINSQLAREINVALQSELSIEDNKKLLQEFVKENFVNAGICADIAIHKPTPKDGEPENPHAHIMLTTREVSPEGFTEKNRNWNDKALLEEWREKWAVCVNKEFERQNIPQQIDHRSNQEQGKEQLPTVHLGHTAHAMEQKGIETDRGNINRNVKETNMDLERNRAELERLRFQLRELDKEITELRERVTEKEKVPKAERARPERDIAPAGPTAPAVLTDPPEAVEKKLQALIVEIDSTKEKIAQLQGGFSESDTVNYYKNAQRLNSDYRHYKEFNTHFQNDRTALKEEQEKGFFSKDRKKLDELEKTIVTKQEVRQRLIGNFEKTHGFSPVNAKEKVSKITNNLLKKAEMQDLKQKEYTQKIAELRTEIKGKIQDYRENYLLVSFRPDGEQLSNHLAQKVKETRQTPQAQPNAQKSFNAQMEWAKTRSELRKAPTPQEYKNLLSKLEKTCPDIALKVAEKLKELTKNKIKEFEIER